ncbi:helix-turn-helix domain-containing protein [Microtetraspora sp. AC03309]|uniref:helix-turn-helix domain-containing protein n=1 Tax=Microtetraspora sp. AC03309 TaxID=2779376 RepID=UPI001E4E3170|nr:hypothetical protein [Microtetraspora sp. AC03309]MCC5578947.1 helix-turn-helix domain-containing protein [Microtetraspora sp. AC03309]
MLLRLAYLTVTNTFAALRLLPMSDRDKDVEILALRHQITVLERQLGADARVRFAPEDRAFLAALLTSLPRKALRRLRLLVRPDTVLRWHRDLMKRRHVRTCRPKRPGRPPTARSTRALILRLVRENPGWGYRRVHGELATLGIKVAPSTVWEILKQEGHLRHALREYEQFYNQHRAHQALNQAAPLRTVPDPIMDPGRITDLNVRRRDRLGRVLHEYSHAA